MRKWIVLFFLCTLVVCACLPARQGLWINEAEAGIVLKTTVVNPSKIKTQTAVLKAYLPKEAAPEDIVNLGDLKIDYDITKALYYVYKEVELAPGESAIRSVEIRDIWVISKAEIDVLTGQAKEIVEKLKKTAYFDTAVTLQADIETKSNEILSKQEEAAKVLPQKHIAVYRENVEVLDLIKTTLTRLDDMLLKAKVTTPERAPRERVSIVKANWWVILGVIISLGLLSFVFFIIWHRQAGVAELKQKKETGEETKTGEMPHSSEEEGENK